MGNAGQRGFDRRRFHGGTKGKQRVGSVGSSGSGRGGVGRMDENASCPEFERKRWRRGGTCWATGLVDIVVGGMVNSI